MNRKKSAAAPAQGFLRQAAAAKWCGVSRMSLFRAARLFELTSGRCGLRSRRAGRCVMFRREDLSEWVELGCPTGVHRGDDGKIGFQVAVAN